MQIKHQILLLSILPLIVTCGIFGSSMLEQSQRLAEQQATLLEASFLESKRAELRNYVELATSMLEPLYAAHDADDDADDDADGIREAQTKAKALLAKLSYGGDGYFFALDLAGNNLVHPRQPELVGRNLLDITDAQGHHIISQLLAAAVSGDGFYRYVWRKPSTNQTTEKLGHVVVLPRWGWVIGTGTYLDDIQRVALQLRERSADNARSTMQRLALMGVALIAMVGVANWALNVSQQRFANRKLRLSMRRSHTLIEEERTRVACELHDGLSQMLVGAKYHLEAARQGAASHEHQPNFEQGLKELGRAIADVRLISSGLRPSDLDRADRLGLIPAIRELATGFGERTSTRLRLIDQLGDVPLPQAHTDALFRIAQEALANAEKHASARHVDIHMVRERKRLRLTVEDDGCGFEVKQAQRGVQGGLGLWTMRYRIEHLGGEFLLESRPGSHTVVSVSLPLKG
ncbi:MAG: hypothetical protein RL033_6686 [Pseudomonadota bacterium]